MLPDEPQGLSRRSLLTGAGALGVGVGVVTAAPGAALVRQAGAKEASPPATAPGQAAQPDAVAGRARPRDACCCGDVDEPYCSCCSSSASSCCRLG